MTASSVMFRHGFFGSAVLSLMLHNVVLVLILPSIQICSALSSSPSSPSSSSSSSVRIQMEVCQKKDCCRKFGRDSGIPHSEWYTLPQILADLAPSTAVDTSPVVVVEVQETSCLSHCDKGPNVRVNVVNSNNKDHNKKKNVEKASICHGIEDHVYAAAALEDLGCAVPKAYMAAVTVLEKAQQASTTEEKDFFISSVIRTLEQQPDASSVLMRALVMRAELHFECGRWAEAIQDAGRVLENSSIPTLAVRRRAYRLTADAYDRQGNIPKAIETLNAWAASDAGFQKKISKEMERLASRTR